MADPFDIAGSNQPAPDGGISPDVWRNLMAFGSQMAVAANARTPQGFLAYGNGIAGPLGAGVQGALAQSVDTARVRSQLGLQGLQGANLRSEIETRGLQNQMTQEQLRIMKQYGEPQQTFNPFAGGGDDAAPGPQSDAGGGYRGATFEDAIDGGEGRGRNPRSSAQGFGGFIDGTWQKFSQANPHFFTGMSPEQVMAVRSDPEIGPQIGKEAVRWLARENAPALEREGVKPSGQSLALAHRLDPVSAVAVMKAPAGMAMPEVLMKGFLPSMGQEKALEKTTAYLKANPDLVADKNGVPVTAGDVRAKFAKVPDPAFLASRQEPRFASAGGPTALSDVPLPLVEPGARAAPAAPMQIAQAPQSPAIPSGMPRPDPRILQEIDRLNNQARAMAAAKLDPRPALQEASRLSALAYGPLQAWQTEQAKAQFAGPVAAAQSQATLPADLAKLGQQQMPGGTQSFIPGGAADPRVIGEAEAARRKAQTEADIATKRATTDIETGAEGRKVALRTAAEQLFGPEGQKRYEGANQTIGWTEKMEAAFSQLNQGDAWSKTGTWAKNKMEFAKGVNSFLETLGAKPVFDEKKVASWEALKKETQTAGMELLTSLFGASREAASTIVSATAAVPADANTPEGAMKVLNGIREAAKHQIDRRNFMVEFGKQSGDWIGAGEAFDKKFPPNMYARRAISLGDPYKIKDQSELSRYLPGTHVITPDGQRRVVPEPGQ